MRWRGAVVCGLLALAIAGCDRKPKVPYAAARAVMDKHCVSCHSEKPTIPAFPIAPNGLMLDTAEQMQKAADKIRARTVHDKSMPLLNKTGMTDEERAIVDGWVESGAPGP